MASIIEVTSIREFTDGSKTETAKRLYISSRQDSASRFAKWIRSHWGIENNCHWVADVIFNEDEAQTNVGHSAENMSIFRRLAMNMAATADPERGMASVRRAAAFRSGYLKGILDKIFLKKRVKSF